MKIYHDDFKARFNDKQCNKKEKTTRKTEEE